MNSSNGYTFNTLENVSGGVWISPAGVIFGVPLTHIRAVVASPADFGLSSKQVKDIYSRHGEGIGSEGNARDEIIALLVSNGWVRVRYHPGDFGFHVELSTLGSHSKNYLSAWASMVLSKHPERAGFPVRLCEVQAGNFEHSFKLESLAE